MRFPIRLAAPALLLAAGALRWLDGHDRHLGDEPWWSLGHLVLLGAVAMFVALVADVRRVAEHRSAVTAAVVVAAIGAAGLTVVILGEVWSRFAPPDLVSGASAVLLVLGVVGTLAALAAARQVSWLEPALALLGFAAIVADLDLLAVGAALLAGSVAQAPAKGPVR